MEQSDLDYIAQMLALKNTNQVKPVESYPGYYSIADLSALIKLDRKKKRKKLIEEPRTTGKVILQPGIKENISSPGNPGTFKAIPWFLDPRLDTK